MTEPLAYGLIVPTALVAVWAGWLTLRNQRVNNPLFYAVAALELVLIAAAVGGFVALALTERDVDGITFGGYLFTLVLVLPIGITWGASDKSRWGAGVVLIAALVVIVLVWRLVQIWQAPGV